MFWQTLLKSIEPCSYLQCSLFAFKFWKYLNSSKQKSSGTNLLTRLPPSSEDRQLLYQLLFSFQFCFTSFKRGNFQNKIWTKSAASLYCHSILRKQRGNCHKSLWISSHFLMTVTWEVVCKISGGLGKEVWSVKSHLKSINYFQTSHPDFLQGKYLS